jgi:alpha-1,6-mannosyltransferase
MKVDVRKTFLLLLVSGILIEIFLLIFLFLNGSGNIPLYMFIYFECFLVFFFAYYVIKKNEKQDKINEEKSSSILGWVSKIIFKNRNYSALKIPFLILLFGIIFRVTLLPTEPTTSPDVYRYLWEGKVVLNGYNPFVYPPESPELSHLQSEMLPEKLPFKNIPAIYPPFAQTVFAFSFWIFGESVTGLKLIFLFCEILTMVFLLKLLLLKKINPNYLLLYGWLPLPIMEFFINAHLDPLGIMFMIIFIYYLESGKHLAAAVPFALSFLSKLFPIILIPLLIKKLGIKKFFYFFLIFFFITFSFYYPFVYHDPQIFTALFKYISRWEFYGSAYNLFKWITSDGETARLICTAMLIASVGMIANYYKDFIKGTFAVFLCLFIFTATLYPWYLGWLAVLNPFAGFASALSLFFTINFTNFTPLAEVWKEYTIILFIQYVPFFLLLIYDLKKRMGTS